MKFFDYEDIEIIFRIIILPFLIIGIFLNYLIQIVFDLITSIGFNFSKNFLINRNKRYYENLIILNENELLQGEQNKSFDLRFRSLIDRKLTFINLFTNYNGDFTIDEIFDLIDALDIETVYLDERTITSYLKNAIFSKLNKSNVARVIITDYLDNNIDYFELHNSLKNKKIILRIPYHLLFNSLDTNKELNKLFINNEAFEIELIIPDRLMIEDKDEVMSLITDCNNILKKYIIHTNFYKAFDLNIKTIGRYYTLPKLNNTCNNLRAISISHEDYFFYEKKILKSIDFEMIFNALENSSITSFYYPLLKENKLQKEYFIENLHRTNIIAPVDLSNNADIEINNQLKSNLKRQKDLLIGIGLMFARNSHNKIPFNVSLNILLFLYDKNFLSSIAYSNDDFLYGPMNSIIENSCDMYVKKKLI